MSKAIQFSNELRQALLSGIKIVSDAVKLTLGPRGRNVLIEQPGAFPTITKDGVTVAKAVNLKDQIGNLGVQAIIEAASKTNDVSGDGTTTCVVLAEAIFREGVKHLTSGANPMEIQRGINLAVEAVVSVLDDMAKPVSNKEEITQVATIAANGDTEIGAYISEAMEKVGKEGIVTIEESKTTATSVEIVDGMQFPNGYLSAYFVKDQVKQSVTFEDCYILIHEKKISDVQKLATLLGQVAETSKPLLIIAEDLDGPVLTMMVINTLRGSLASCAVKAPLFGNYRKDILRDIAVLTGGFAFTEDLGIGLDKITLEHLGRAKKVTVSKDSTTIVEGFGKEQAVKDRIELIKNQMPSEPSDYGKERLQDRLAKLTGGVAVITIGATTESALKEKKYRIEDALQATRAAVEEGIVPGGGTALVRCLAAISLEQDGLSRDEMVGFNIVIRAIQEPLRQIASNAGKEGTVILEKVKASKEINYGYNARTDVFEDLVVAGVIDPKKVTRVALENAASVAGLLLTTDAAIIELKEKDTK
jgi:chaperonin GroEL